jgi:hypothetical protein
LRSRNGDERRDNPAIDHSTAHTVTPALIDDVAKRTIIAGGKSSVSRSMSETGRTMATSTREAF